MPMTSLPARMLLVIAVVSSLTLLGLVQAAPAQRRSASPDEEAGAAEVKAEQSRIEDLPPIPLPRDCDDVTPPGGDPVTCCAFGYIFYSGEPVAGATVTIESDSGSKTLTTAPSGGNDDPYYAVALDIAPLYAEVGSVLSITVEYEGQTTSRFWTVTSQGQ